jgi:hypothetical protein
MKNPWFALSLFLVATTVIASSTTVYYYTQYSYANNRYQETLSKLRSSTYTVNISIKFNSTTWIWYNNTIVPIGWSLFNATQMVTEGNMNYSIFYGAPFVTSILGVKSQGLYSWLWWSWNSTKGEWQMGEVGSSDFVLKEGSTVVWFLVDTATWPPTGP